MFTFVAFSPVLRGFPGILALQEVTESHRPVRFVVFLVR